MRKIVVEFNLNTELDDDQLNELAHDISRSIEQNFDAEVKVYGWKRDDSQ